MSICQESFRYSKAEAKRQKRGGEAWEEIGTQK